MKFLQKSTTGKNTVVWKFYGKNYVETVPFYKIYTSENQA